MSSVKAGEGGRKLGNAKRSLAACLMAALILMALVTRATPTCLEPLEPRGMVDQPRLQTFSVSPARDTQFEFKGWVDFPGSAGRVYIDVLNSGNGDSHDALNWEIEVATAIPEVTATVVEGEKRFAWSVGPIAIFQASKSGQDRWPEGGTARIRFVALRKDADGSERHAVLPVQDTDGVEGGISELIVSDGDPRPSSPSGQRSTPDYLNKKPALGFVETQRYYDSVSTQPNGKFSDDSDGIRSALRTLGKFQARYFSQFEPSERVSVRARYYNHGDLGIGRDMNCKFTPRTQETACYVRNYGGRNGEPLFGDMAESFEALKADKPFATVAMVERGLMRRDAPNKVFFVVYDSKGNLTTVAPLDNKGFNKFIPGNCLVCHGAGGSYKTGTHTGGSRFDAEVRGAFFLPFDLSSFGFFSADPADPLSRAHQEAAFKSLNRLVSGTDLKNLPHAVELLNGWYGGPEFPGGAFDGTFVPEGWNQDQNTRQLYLQVVGKTCRSCHISHPSLTFGTLEQFSTLKGLIYDDVCRPPYSMPNAEQTQNIFWESSARPQLLNRLPIQFGCGFQPFPRRAPGPPVSGDPVSRPAQEVFLGYRTESCACATKECLEGVEEKYLHEFAGLTVRETSEQDMIDSLKREAVDCHQRVLATGFGAGPPPSSPAQLSCDADGDQDVDRNDIAAIVAARNTPTGIGNRCDVDRDGQITVNDARACTLRCTKPNCAP